MEKGVALLLMDRILAVVKESGANAREAQSALGAAAAMLPEVGLPVAMVAIET